MYLLFFIFASLLSLLYFNKKQSKIILYILGIFLILFAGTRNSDVSSDYDAYEFMFSSAVNNIADYFYDFSITELSVFIIPQFAHSILISEVDYVRLSFIIFALIGVSTKLKVLSNSDYFFWGMMIYLSNLYLGQEMITIRAGVASGIFLLSIKDIVNKNDKAFFIKMGFAFLFHYTSILFILIWALIKFRISLKNYLWGLVISLFIAFNNINILSLLLINRIFPKVNIYLESAGIEGNDTINVFNFRIIFALLITLFFLFSYKKYKDNNYFEVLFKIHVFSLIVFFALSSINKVFSLRSYELLSVIQLLLYPMILQIFQQKFKIIGYFVILAYCIFSFYYFLEITTLFNPYNSWLI